MSYINNPSTGGGGSGTVTSVAGGVGITNSPEPIVAAGTVDLDIDSLTAETAPVAGDLFPFLDVSVGLTPASQRKVTLANLIAGGGATTGSGVLDRLAIWASATSLTSDANLRQAAISGGLSLIVQREFRSIGDGVDANFIAEAYGAGSEPSWFGFRARGTFAVPDFPVVGDALLRVRGKGWKGAAFADSTGIRMRADETFSATALGGSIRFETTIIGTLSLAERLAILDTGEVAHRSGPARQLTLENASAGRTSFVDSAHAATLDYTLPTAIVTSGYLKTTAGGVMSWALVTAAEVTAGAALTKADDTNVTLTLGGTPATALLAASSLTLGWAGQLSIARGGTGQATALAAFNALSPLTTRGDLLTRNATDNSRVAIGATARILQSDGTDPSWVAVSADATLATGGALTLASIITAGGPTGSATVAPIITWDAKGRLTVVSSATITPAASSITGGAALTRVDDTNVTLVLGGAPSTALLAATSLTLGWTGTLSVTRGGTSANLSATGGAKQYVKQASVGGAFTVGTIPMGDLTLLATQTTLTTATSVEAFTTNIVDATVLTTSTILMWTVNELDSIQFEARANAGSFDVEARALRFEAEGFLKGDFKVAYLVL